MATTRKDAPKKDRTKEYCDSVFVELSQMQKRLLAMTGELAGVYGEKSALYRKFERYLNELADQIEWRLQILSHSCPHDWKGSEEGVESEVQVAQIDIPV